MKRGAIKSRSVRGGTCEDESECWGGDGKTVFHPLVGQPGFQGYTRILLNRLILTEPVESFTSVMTFPMSTFLNQRKVHRVHLREVYNVLCSRVSCLGKGQRTIKIVTSHLLWTLKVITKHSAAVELLLSTLSNRKASLLIPPRSNRDESQHTSTTCFSTTSNMSDILWFKKWFLFFFFGYEGS